MTEARHSTVLEMCLTAIGNNGQQLNNQLRSIYLPSFGLDFFLDDQKRTILHVLAENLQFEHWEVLLKGFVYIDGTDIRQQTALHIAVKSRNLRAVHHLILNCASPIVEDDHGKNPIQYACENDFSVGLVEILQNYAARQYISNNSVTIGKLCIESKSKSCFELIVANIPPSRINAVDDNNFALIHYICQSTVPEDADYLQILIKYHADINLKTLNSQGKTDKTPIELATIPEIAEILFSMNASYNKKNVSELISSLIQRSSQWQQTGRCFYNSELHKAVLESNMNYIKSYKGKVDIISSAGITPLILALKNKNDDIVEELLAKGADPMLMREPMQYSAYHYAALHGQLSALNSFFIRKPPDFNVLDYKQRSIITCCVVNGQLEALNFILARKPQIDSSIISIMESLNRLDENTAISITEALFKEGFPLNVAMESGKTLLRAAYDDQKFSLLKLILNYVKKVRTSAENSDSRQAKDDRAMVAYLLETDQPCFINAVVNEMPVDIIQAFLEAGFNPKLYSRGRPLIHETACHFKSEIRNLFLQGHDELVDARDSVRNTFLHRAASLNNEVSINDGLSYKISPNDPNNDGETPLHFLMMSRLRTTNGNATNSSGNNANNNLFNNSNGTTSSDKLGKDNINEYNLSNYRNHFINEDSMKLKHVKYSTFAGRLEIHEDDGKFAMEEEANFEKNLDILLKAGADPTIKNNKGQNIFHICAINNNEIAVNVLLKVLPEETINKIIQERDNDNKTPLEIASKERNDSTKCARALSNVVQMPIFDSPLTVKNVEYLVNNGYSLNIYNKEGIPLLTAAILMFSEKETEKDSVLLVKTILDNNANPSIEDRNKTDPYGKYLTPLHHAIMVGSFEISSLLVEKGASFIVSPACYPFADEWKQEEIRPLLKKPEARAGSIEELYNTHKNAAIGFTALLRVFDRTDRILDNSKVEHYVYDITFMRRLLRNFVDRIGYIFFNLKPSSELGNFLLYFKDAYVPLLGVSVEYEDTKEIIANDNMFSDFLSQGTGIGSQTVSDILIVPTQVFTWYTSLIDATIKNTPADHPDCQPLQAAKNKFSFLGSSVTENQRIANSQKKLQSLKFVVTINDQTTQFTYNDILYYHGSFELKSFKRPCGPFEVEEKDDPYAQSNEWGIKTLKRRIGAFEIFSYYSYGSSIESFINKNKIAIYLFKNSILFGVQKTADKFKLKFSCKPYEVHWDFGKEYGNDSMMVYTPFGSMFLKCLPTNGSNEDLTFVRKEWINNVGNIFKYQDEDEEISSRNFEYCYISWVGEESKSILSRHFLNDQCKTKTEAKDKFKQQLINSGIVIKHKTDPVTGEQIPMINYQFQTLQRSEGQESDIISDIDISID